MHYSNQKLSIIHYRKFKDFGNDVLVKDLNMLLSKSYNKETIPFQALKESASATIEKKKKHAPSKTRYTRANQVSYMNKKL